MLAFVRGKIRQAGYRWLKFSDEPLYLLFEKMYQCDPHSLRTVTPHPTERGFLVADFTHPRFIRYRGREIAFVNARHAAVYWLPGASHGGGGYVKSGVHAVTMGGHAMRPPVRLGVVKDDDNTEIRSVSLEKQSARSMDGCRISFQIIATELHCLARRWLARTHEQLDAVQDDASVREVIAAAQALRGFDDLGRLADSLRSRLDARRKCLRNGEGESNADMTWSAATDWVESANVVSVHETFVACPAQRVGALLDQFDKPLSPCWPHVAWPRDRFDGPVRVGAVGGHGATRYRVVRHLPGQELVFRFESPPGFEGVHGLRVTARQDGSVITHFSRLRLSPYHMCMWRCVVRWVHDALIGDLLDGMERHLTGKVERPRRWKWRVYFFRHALGGLRLLIENLKLFKRNA